MSGSELLVDTGYRVGVYWHTSIITMVSTLQQQSHHNSPVGLSWLLIERLLRRIPFSLNVLVQ